VEHTKGVSVGYFALPRKHFTILERLVRDKFSSLIRKFVNYGRKMLYNSGLKFQSVLWHWTLMRSVFSAKFLFIVRIRWNHEKRLMTYGQSNKQFTTVNYGRRRESYSNQPNPCLNVTRKAPYFSTVVIYGRKKFVRLAPDFMN